MPERQRLLTTLDRLLRIPAVDLEAVMMEAADLLAEVFGAEKFDVMLLEASTSTLVALGTSKTPMGERQRQLGLHRLQLANGGRAVQVYETGRSHCGSHVDEDPEEIRGIPEALGVRSEIIAPLDIDGRRRGAILASSGRPDAFSDEDVRFLETISRWIGLIAHRSELTEKVAAAAADEARRLTAEELVTILAHDLRNHLTAARGHLGLVRRRTERYDDASVQVSLARTTQALERIGTMTNDLLDVARLERGTFAITPMETDLAALVRTTIESLESPREVDLQAPESLSAIVDADRVRQALENLLRNAFEHAEPDSRVAVRLSEETRADGPWARIAVENRGEPVPPQLLDHLVRPFAAGAASLGVGLGLYIVHGIVLAHGGELSVTSADVTSFQIILPTDLQTLVG